jgi:3-hydroxymyristoyl/3-hydroxydecanoyl-(acyl carrier protein) dehydratase
MIMDTREEYLNIIHNGNLVGISPTQVMLHGPTKLLVDNYHWHSPKVGIVASYSPKERDVEDHFGIFRGVDQVESFAQATIVSCATFSECRKNNCTPDELKDRFIPAFISIGNVNFHYYLEAGDTFISIGNITFYKWRQMVCDGRIYKVPKGLNLDDYFKDFTEERLLNYDISEDFKLVADLAGITGRAILIELFKKSE